MRTIWVMVCKQMTQGTRDLQTMMIMVAMPLVFLGILQMAFAPTVTNDAFNETVIRYCLEEGMEEEQVEYLLAPLQGVYDQVLPFRVADYDSMKDIVLRFVDTTHIGIYYQQELQDQAQILEVILKNSTEHVGKSIAAKKVDYIQIGTSEQDALIRYYGITMLTLTIMFASISGAYSMIKERDRSTLYKLRGMPCHLGHILVGKGLGSSSIVLLQSVCMMYLIQMCFGVEWGVHKFEVLVLLWSEGFFATALGMWLGTWFKDYKSAWLILLLVIMSMGFLAGAFVPLGEIQMLGFEKWGHLLPLTRLNQVLFEVIYAGKNQAFYPTCYLNLILGGGLLAVTWYRVEGSV
ncbi:MAG: ABC transporter permease [Cellulosilyticaceae bacterium]